MTEVEQVTTDRAIMVLADLAEDTSEASADRGRAAGDILDYCRDTGTDTCRERALAVMLDLAEGEGVDTEWRERAANAILLLATPSNLDRRWQESEEATERRRRESEEATERRHREILAVEERIAEALEALVAER
jgi:hypothetical protein